MSSSSSSSIVIGFKNRGMLSWTRRDRNACQVHACWLKGSEWGHTTAESTIGPLATSRVDSPHLPLVSSSIPGFRSPLYFSASAHPNGAKQMRLTAIGEATIVFEEGEGTVTEGYKPIPSRSMPRRVVAGVNYQSQTTTAFYLADGSLAVLADEPDANLSSSSSSSTKHLTSSSSSSTYHKSSSSSKSSSSTFRRTSSSSSSRSKSSFSSSSSTKNRLSSSSRSTSSCSWCHTSSSSTVYRDHH